LIILSLLPLVAKTGAVFAAEQPVEIAYDDGKNEDAYHLSEAGLGDYMAVRFSSPYASSVVVTVLYYIAEKPDAFTALVLDSNRKVIFEKSVKPTATGWFAVDLSGKNILVGGDFYVAMKWSVDGRPTIGADGTKPDGRSFYVNPDGTWQPIKDVASGDFDLMIRAKVVPGPVLLELVDVGLNPPASEPVYVGDLVTTTFTLRNAGTAVASRVEVKVVDSPPEVAVVQVTSAAELAAGATSDWEVILKPENEGEFKVLIGFFIDGVRQVFDFGESFTIKLTVQLKAPLIALTDLTADPTAEEPFYVGDTGTVTFVLQNKGQTRAKSVEVRVISCPPEVEIVEVSPAKDLEPGATGQWQVKTKPTKAGDFEVTMSVYVDGERVTYESQPLELKFTVRASERPFLETYGLYVGAGLIAIVLIVVAVLAMRRRSRAPAPPAVVPAAPAPAVAAAVAVGKFCVNCGSRIPDDSVFCPRCRAQQP
jgi:uncharacterized repeat protein (TIGR01451 family)